MSAERLRDAQAQAASLDGASKAELGEFGILIAGEWIKTGDAIEVRSPYDDTLVGIVHRAGPEHVERAIAASVRAFEETRHLPSWKRAEVLEKISAGIIARREELARTIALEAGKPIRTARIEVDRAAFTFKIAAEESKRIYGEIVPLDWIPGTEGRTAYIQRVPRGPVAGITPFNFPINLVAHKVAPALAAGDPIIVRPATQTPISSVKLAEIVLEAGWPAEGIAVIPCSTKDAAPLVEDPRIKVLTFTGSPAVGWDLRKRAGQKMVTLELGGNAGVIVHEDADTAHAATRVAWGGFSYAGQSCISVQRVYAHGGIYEEFVDQLIPKVQGLVVGNPLDEATDIGPVIDRGASDRIEEWLKEAVQAGAHVLTGGQHDGNVWQPTVLSAIREDMKVSCQEVFGPLVGLYRYDDVLQAIHEVDNGDFGLQAGLFTNDWNIVQTAFDHIQVGGLMVNDVSTFRIDHMPYGGVKMSGMGREGLRYAIEEMTEMKLLTYHHREPQR
jgi:glyceraldehyde-3-phosphate dehydrogenase (NADP+)